MISTRSFRVLKSSFLVLIFVGWVLCDEEVCDRRLLGTKTAPLPPDNRFSLDIQDIEDKYIPEKQYTVTLSSRDGQSTFIAFTISAREDTEYNSKNPRKPIYLDPGKILPAPNDNDTKSSPDCNNVVIQSQITAKKYVKALWIAPGKENKCVTLQAVVAMQPHVWYNHEGPLIKRVCEDRRKLDDMQPIANNNCQVCEEARYQLTFKGMWSFNTHPLMFPSSNASKDPSFSDLVGASHNINFNVFKDNDYATPGLRMLAEQANTTKLEMEILDKLGTDVRTIIKATGPPKPNMTTTATFRVSPKHHVVSLVSAIIPSPDWFLGVSNLELCDVQTQQWAEKIRYNLYPMDAGTDSGQDFEAANEETSPHQPISWAVITKKVSKENIKPFARLQFNLIRTYSSGKCTTEVSNRSEGGFDYTIPDEETTEPTSPRAEGIDSESPVDCPMSEWEEWNTCDGICENGKLRGITWRERYHLVDGVAVEKYDPNTKTSKKKEVHPYCKSHYERVESKECEEPCTDTKKVTG